MPINKVNELSLNEFIATFGNVVEKCRLAASSVWTSEGFENVEELKEAFTNFLDSLTSTGQRGVIRGFLSYGQSSGLSPESTEERKSANMLTLSNDEISLLSWATQSYFNKFGFPFVICSKEHEKEAILKSVQDRLLRSKAAEVKEGIEQVKRICGHRIDALVHK